jgi:hypothetical protein
MSVGNCAHRMAEHQLMTIKLDHWQFGTTELLLIDIEGDPLSPYVMSNVLTAALGITPNQLDIMRSRHPERLTPISLESLTLQSVRLRDFVKDNAAALGLKRVRGNVLLWPLKIALRAYKYSNSRQADQFYDEGIDMMLQYAARNGIVALEYKTRLEALERALSLQASAAGQTLSLHRYTKDIRTLN